MTSAATKTEIAWFGGYAGAIEIKTHLLHLVKDNGDTFCGCRKILTAATPLNLGKAMWCDFCVHAAQEVRRDV